MAISEQPLEQELAQTIITQILPALRELYGKLVAMQVQWHDEDFQAALADAAKNGTLLAGFPAETWQAWGVALLAFQEYSQTPLEELKGRTILGVVNRRYVAPGAMPSQVPQ